MTTVSVAIATYNGAAFVEEQLESILGQNPPPAEVVVSDDGSDDDTVAIVRAVATVYPATAVHVVAEGNQLGVSGNFERALRATTGDLVALSDQDDRWHAGRLAAIVAHFEADPELILLHHDADLVDATGARLGRTLFGDLLVTSSERSLIADGRAFAAYIRRNLATGATVVFRRSLLDSALPVPAGWVHDEWLAVVAAATGGVRLLGDALIDYRQHDSNQIGVAEPSLRYRVGRMLSPRATRYLDLAARSATLVRRLDSITAVPEWRALAARKAAFESARAAYPANRFARIPAVLRQRRNYGVLSSQGALDVLRDIVQPV